MSDQEKCKTGDPLVIGYLGLRKAIGLIGVALPIVLVAGKWLLESPGIQSSISSYYYSVMRDVLVGSLCSIAVFMLSYRGYERKDDIAGDMACVFAVGVALFPTTPDTGATQLSRTIGAFHLIFAGAFFLTLAYFSLVLFRKTDPAKPPTLRKVMRNGVYLACGIIILASIVAIGVVKLFPDDAAIYRFDPVFWLESAAIWAFGWSWLTKGELILQDE